MDSKSRRGGGSSSSGGAGGRGRGYSGGGGHGGRGRGYRPNPNNVAVFRQPNAPYGEGASVYQQGLGSGRSGYIKQTPTQSYGRSGDSHDRGDAPRQTTAAPHQGRGSKGGKGGRFESVEVPSLNPSSMSNG